MFLITNSHHSIIYSFQTVTVRDEPISISFPQSEPPWLWVLVLRILLISLPLPCLTYGIRLYDGPGRRTSVIVETVVGQVYSVVRPQGETSTQFPSFGVLITVVKTLELIRLHKFKSSWKVSYLRPVSTHLTVRSLSPCLLTRFWV